MSAPDSALDDNTLSESLTHTLSFVNWLWVLVMSIIYLGGRPASFPTPDAAYFVYFGGPIMWAGLLFILDLATMFGTPVPGNVLLLTLGCDAVQIALVGASLGSMKNIASMTTITNSSAYFKQVANLVYATYVIIPIVSSAGISLRTSAYKYTRLARAGGLGALQGQGEGQAAQVPSAGAGTVWSSQPSFGAPITNQTTAWSSAATPGAVSAQPTWNGAVNSKPGYP